MTSKFRTSAFAVLALAVAAVNFAQEPAASQAPKSAKSKFEETLAQAEAQYQAENGKAALSLFEKANGMQKGGCPDCLLGMARVHLAMLQLKDATRMAEKVVALPGVAPQDVARAREMMARSSLRRALMDGNAHAYSEGEGILRQAIGDDPNRPPLHYFLGMALLGQARDEEGVAELKRYLDREPSGEYAKSAAALVADPRRGHPDHIIDFKAPTADGGSIDTEALRGKVVLLDFWASWCAPCRRTLPDVKTLAARMAAEPLVVISVSSDRDEKKWREFVAKNQMTWPQIYSRQMHGRYVVTAIPTFIVVDKAGVMRARLRGANKKDELLRVVEACLKESAR